MRVVDGKANRPATLGFIISQKISMIYESLGNSN